MSTSPRSPKVQTVPRPYMLVFLSSGNAYPLSATEAQRLIDEYPVTYASRNRVELRGDGAGSNSRIIPATLGGGPAFEVTR
jgi:hypothetical protein